MRLFRLTNSQAWAADSLECLRIDLIVNSGDHDSCEVGQVVQMISNHCLDDVEVQVLILMDD